MSEGFFNTRIKCAMIGPVQLQVVQPGKGRSIYKDFLEQKGEGVFHLGFVVEDIATSEAEVRPWVLRCSAAAGGITAAGLPISTPPTSAA